MKILKQDNIYLRCLTIQFLGKIGDKRALDPIFDVIREEFENKRIKDIYWWTDEFYFVLHNLKAFEEFFIEFIENLDLISNVFFDEGAYHRELIILIEKTLGREEYSTQIKRLLEIMGYPENKPLKFDDFKNVAHPKDKQLIPIIKKIVK